jgi:DNA-binding LacI/PurR family transcriptional regulator
VTIPRERGQTQPTLEQVAALAGVGRGTVSRVVNGSSQVSERTRRAVEKAVAELGYVPNLAARALVTRRTDTVALVISEPEHRIFGEPFFAGIVRGISAAVTDSERQLVLAMAQTDAQVQQLDRYLTRQHVDGVLLVSQHRGDRLPAVLAERDVPVVLGGRPLDPGGGWYVDVDNVTGAREAVAYLLGGGSRKVATVTGPQDMVAGLDRYTGYTAALEEAGIAVDTDLVVEGDFSQHGGERAAHALLARRPDLDAIFAANDPMAAGVLTVLKDFGRDVPGDVAVIGFDDSETAQHTQPPLTTVSQPTEQMGRAMVDLLLEQMDGGGADPRHVLLPTTLRVRESA